MKPCPSPALVRPRSISDAVMMVDGRHSSVVQV
jgi:hypothetical protein